MVLSELERVASIVWFGSFWRNRNAGYQSVFKGGPGENAVCRPC